MVLNNLANLLVPPRWRKRRDGEEEEEEERRRCCGCTGRQFRLSTLSDADIMADWAFFNAIKSNEQIPKGVVSAEWVLVLLATLIYLLQVTEGRLLKKWVRKCTGVTLTKKNIVDAGVWLEDLPQIALSAFVAFGTSAGTSLPVLANLITSALSAREKLEARWADDIPEIVEEEGTAEEQQPILPVSSTSKG